MKHRFPPPPPPSPKHETRKYIIIYQPKLLFTHHIRHHFIQNTWIQGSCGTCIQIRRSAFPEGALDTKSTAGDVVIIIIIVAGVASIVILIEAGSDSGGGGR